MKRFYVVKAIAMAKADNGDFTSSEIDEVELKKAIKEAHPEATAVTPISKTFNGKNLEILFECTKKSEQTIKPPPLIFASFKNSKNQY